MTHLTASVAINASREVKYVIAQSVEGVKAPNVCVLTTNSVYNCCRTSIIKPYEDAYFLTRNDCDGLMCPDQTDANIVYSGYK